MPTTHPELWSFVAQLTHLPGVAFRDMKGKLYPVVGMKRTGEHIRANFGQTPFIYDIDAMMKQEQTKIWKAVSATSTAKLTSPSTTETELIQQLVCT